MNKPALPPIRRTDRPSALKGAPGWASMLRTRAGSHADDPALTAVIQTHQRLVDGWDALEQVRQNRNPKHTGAQHLDVVGKSAKAMIERYSKQSDGLIDAVTHRRNSIKSEINERLGVRKTEELAEVRALLRGMKSTERGEMLSRAIEDGDTVVMSALMLSESPTLLGMSSKQVDEYRVRAIRRHAHDLLELDDALQAAQELTVDALTQSTALAEKAVGDPHTRREFEQQTSAADEAALAFHQTIS